MFLTSYRSLVYSLCFLLALKGVGQITTERAEALQYIQQAQDMGYTDDQILEVAAGQGATDAELKLLRAQLELAEDEEEPETDRNRVSEELIRARFTIRDNPGQIFGQDLFSNESKMTLNLLNVPTPSDYRLGPGDELYIDIFGASEKYYIIPISPEGTITLTNIGPIYVNNLTIEEATRKIRLRLQKVYTGLSAGKGTTFLSVSLGNVKSINVSLVGEVRAPGTYEMNGLSTVFNALYIAGGPKESGTYREIKVYRNSKHISSIDLYDFLIKGQNGSNLRLQSGDVIMIEPYQRRIEIKGEVKRPGRYELLEDESFADLLSYAGGFTDAAYKAKINVIRNTSSQKAVSDIYPEQFEIFSTQGGDVYTVGRIQDRFENRVLVKGAVFRPGSYALVEGMSLMDLLDKADGLTGDAFLNRVLVLRTNEDFTTETFAYDLSKIDSGEQEDPMLQKEDVLQVNSIYDFKEERYLRISGEVNQPGIFRYSEGMTVENLVFLAKGLKNAAQEGAVEISRRPPEQSRQTQMEAVRLSIDRDLNIKNEETRLIPFDHVIVRRNPNYFEERTVEILGQINFPGTYSIQAEEERVSDVLRRAGGLNEYAFPQGATLIRKTEFFKREQDINQRRAALLSVIEGIDSTVYSESDKFIVDKILEELQTLENEELEQGENLAASAKKERLEELAERNVYLNDIKIRESESIALDLERIMSNPGSPEDLILENGDIINIPKELAMVRMRGKVLYPNTVRYEAPRSAKFYVNKAGGFDSRAKKGRTYVVYANGEVSRTKRFLFFKFYPKAAPGAEVIVPGKPPRIPLRATDAIAITTGLATIAALIIPLTTK